MAKKEKEKEQESLEEVVIEQPTKRESVVGGRLNTVEFDPKTDRFPGRKE